MHRLVVWYLSNTSVKQTQVILEKKRMCTAIRVLKTSLLTYRKYEKVLSWKPQQENKKLFPIIFPNICLVFQFQCWQNLHVDFRTGCIICFLLTKNLQRTVILREQAIWACKHSTLFQSRAGIFQIFRFQNFQSCISKGKIINVVHSSP